MIGERIELWHKEEYHYPAAHGFIPIMVSYIHEDELLHPLPNVTGSGHALIQPETGRLGFMGIAPRKPLLPVVPYAPLGVQQIPLHELGSVLGVRGEHLCIRRSKD